MPVRKYKRTRRIRRRNVRAKKAPMYRKLAKPEVKNYDYAFNNSSITYSGAITEILTNIAQGYQEQQHVGSSIRLKGVNMRFALTAGSSSAFFTNTVRFMLLLGKYENATALNIANVLQTTGASTAPHSLYVYDQRSKYKVLWDKTYQLSTGYVPAIYSGSGASNLNPGFKNTVYVKKYIPLRGIMTKYNLNTATILNHGLYWLVISDVAASGPSILGYARITYSDV